MMSSQAKTWAEFRVPEGLGMDCPRYKWRQNQAGEKVGKHATAVELPQDLPMPLKIGPW